MSALGPWAYQGETNYCADGSAPNIHLANMTINPCSPANYRTQNFTIPAQQFNVAKLETTSGPVVIYYGEQFNSAGWVHVCPVSATSNGLLSETASRGTIFKRGFRLIYLATVLFHQ
jgi:hypothetical protein